MTFFSFIKLLFITSTLCTPLYTLILIQDSFRIFDILYLKNDANASGTSRSFILTLFRVILLGICWVFRSLANFTDVQSDLLLPGMIPCLTLFLLLCSKWNLISRLRFLILLFKWTSLVSLIFWVGDYTDYFCFSSLGAKVTFSKWGANGTNLSTIWIRWFSNVFHKDCTLLASTSKLIFASSVSRAYFE